MATFRFIEEEELEKSLSNFEVTIPLNLTNKIGEGSYSCIYKHTVNGKQTALKVLKYPVPQRKIIESVKKLQNLSHKNVVSFCGFIKSPATIIFELCELQIGEKIFVNNLSDLINIFNENQHFNLLERLDLLMQCAKGLQYLHSKGIVHKDLKPSNCLVNGTLDAICVKIADFDGIVDIKNTVTATKTKTNKDVKFGCGMTLSFAAPEV